MKLLKATCFFLWFLWCIFCCFSFLLWSDFPWLLIPCGITIPVCLAYGRQIMEWTSSFMIDDITEINKEIKLRKTGNHESDK